MRSLALACWVVGAAGVIATMIGEGEAQHPSVPLLAAHRGGSLLWPENSLLAFRNAVALGADFIEFDVHLSRDGEVMVIHDATLDRTTTGSGPVKDRTVAELKAFRLKDRSGAVTQEAIPTLDEVVAVAAQGRRRMLLEIKVDPSKARYPGIEEKVLAILDRHAMAPSTIVMSFEAADVAPRPRAAPRHRDVRPLLGADALAARPWRQSSMPLRAAGVGFIGVERTAVDAGAVAQARQAGIGLGSLDGQ